MKSNAPVAMVAAAVRVERRSLLSEMGDLAKVIAVSVAAFAALLAVLVPQSM